MANRTTAEQRLLDTLGKKIRKLRVAKYGTEDSRRTLQRDSGVTDAAIMKIEDGVSNPTLLTLRRLAAALGVDVGDLL